MSLVMGQVVGDRSVVWPKLYKWSRKVEFYYLFINFEYRRRCMNVVMLSCLNQMKNMGGNLIKNITTLVIRLS